MNAGFIADDNWVNKENIGGGRIIGEACHLIDLCIFFSNSLVKSICMNTMKNVNNEGVNEGSILMHFSNGSNGIINYFTNGSNVYQKERVEIYSNKRTFVIDDYKNTYSYTDKSKRIIKNVFDKGHKDQFHKYINTIRSGNNSLIDFKEIINSTEASFACAKSLKEKNG